jgi:hypothetical protein
LSDQLSRYRRKDASEDTANATTFSNAGKRPYEAYDTSNKPFPYMEIRCILQPSQSPQSRFFMTAVFSADFAEMFTLIYSFMAVEVKGHNLTAIRRAIQMGRCEFIQEYHENEFQEPGKDAPVIESIKFITGEKLDDILASHKAGK